MNQSMFMIAALIGKITANSERLPENERVCEIATSLATTQAFLIEKGLSGEYQEWMREIAVDLDAMGRQK